jgi:hypothetical protein
MPGRSRQFTIDTPNPEAHSLPAKLTESEQEPFGRTSLRSMEQDVVDLVRPPAEEFIGDSTTHGIFCEEYLHIGGQLPLLEVSDQSRVGSQRSQGTNCSTAWFSDRAWRRVQKKLR